MAWNHLFIIDPIENLHPKLDSSIRMMFSLFERKHNIFFTKINDIFLETSFNSSKKSISRGADCFQIFFSENATYENPAFTISGSKSYDLNFFNGIHMRKDPPFDINYISTTWLIDNLRKETKIYNQPEALRNSNEKLLIGSFPEFIAPFIASSNPEKILPFIRQHSDVILKPLHLFGGRGIKRIISNQYNDKQLLDLLTHEMLGSNESQELRLVQPFNYGIEHGEIRVFTAFGEPLSWCLKKPKEGDFLANTRAGASLLPMVPSPRLVEIVTVIAKKLREWGIEIIGFDIIGESVSEINITSPRMLLAPGENYQAPYQRFAQLCENNLEELPTDHL